MILEILSGCFLFFGFCLHLFLEIKQKNSLIGKLFSNGLRICAGVILIVILISREVQLQENNLSPSALEHYQTLEVFSTVIGIISMILLISGCIFYAASKNNDDAAYFYGDVLTLLTWIVYVIFALCNTIQTTAYSRISIFQWIITGFLLLTGLSWTLFQLTWNGMMKKKVPIRRPTGAQRNSQWQQVAEECAVRPVTRNIYDNLNFSVNHPHGSDNHKSTASDAIYGDFGSQSIDRDDKTQDGKGKKVVRHALNINKSIGSHSYTENYDEDISKPFSNKNTTEAYTYRRHTESGRVFSPLSPHAILPYSQSEQDNGEYEESIVSQVQQLNSQSALNPEMILQFRNRPVKDIAIDIAVLARESRKTNSVEKLDNSNEEWTILEAEEEGDIGEGESSEYAPKPKKSQRTEKVDIEGQIIPWMPGILTVANQIAKGEMSLECAVSSDGGSGSGPISGADLTRVHQIPLTHAQRRSLPLPTSKDEDGEGSSIVKGEGSSIVKGEGSSVTKGEGEDSESVEGQGSVMIPVLPILDADYLMKREESALNSYRQSRRSGRAPQQWNGVEKGKVSVAITSGESVKGYHEGKEKAKSFAGVDSKEAPKSSTSFIVRKQQKYVTPMLNLACILFASLYMGVFSMDPFVNIP